MEYFKKNYLYCLFLFTILLFTATGCTFSKKPITINIVDSYQDVDTDSKKWLETAITEFKTLHPEVTVNYRILCENEEDKLTKIDNFNSTLASNTSDDILIMDALPWETYDDSNYLADLSDAIAPFEKDENYYGNIITSFKEDKVYGIPLCFNPGFFIASEEIVPHIDSITTLTDYLAANPEKGSFTAKHFMNPQSDLLTKTLYECFYYDLLNSSETFLTSSKTIYNRISEYQGKPGEFNGKFSFTATPAFAIKTLIKDKEGDLLHGCYYPGFFDDIANAMNTEGYQLQSTQYFKPYAIVGINNNTKHAEVCKEFVSCLLSSKVQKEINTTYFPVCKEAVKEDFLAIRLGMLEHCKEGENRYYTAEAGDDYAITVLSEEQIESLLTLFGESNYPLPTDYSSEKFLSALVDVDKEHRIGKLSLEDAINQLNSAIQTAAQ